MIRIDGKLYSEEEPKVFIKSVVYSCAELSDKFKTLSLDELLLIDTKHNLMGKRSRFHEMVSLVENEIKRRIEKGDTLPNEGQWIILSNGDAMEIPGTKRWRLRMPVITELLKQGKVWKPTSASAAAPAAPAAPAEKSLQEQPASTSAAGSASPAAPAAPREEGKQPTAPAEG